MTYEIWDVATRNLVGDYDTEEQALAFVREVASEHGLPAAEELALGKVNKRGQALLVAAGKELCQRAGVDAAGSAIGLARSAEIKKAGRRQRSNGVR